MTQEYILVPQEYNLVTQELILVTQEYILVAQEYILVTQSYILVTQEYTPWVGTLEYVTSAVGLAILKKLRSCLAKIIQEMVSRGSQILG